MKTNKASDWGGSKLTTFQTCNRKFELSYLAEGTGLTSVEDSYNLSRGTLLHLAFEYFYKSATLNPPAPLEDRVLMATKLAVDEIDTLVMNPDMKALMKNELIACIDQYFEKYGADPDLEPLEVEVPFQVRIGDDVHTGTRDLYARWHGLECVVDHKSTSLDWDRFFKQFKDDLSLKGYVWEKRQTSGIKCDLLINGIRFKRTKNFECEFQRELISFSDLQMEEFPRIVTHIKKQIALCHTEGFFPKSGKQCVTVVGECEFRKYCQLPDPAVINTFFKKKEA